MIRNWCAALVLAAGLASPAQAQLVCGDLNDDTFVDALDDAILRNHLAGIAPLSFPQSLACDVYDDNPGPGFPPIDPSDLTAHCSMVDSTVIARNADAMGPGPQEVCALGSTASCGTPHAGVGCNEPATVECVCAALPACCTVEWDAACAAQAQTPVCSATDAIWVSRVTGLDSNPGTLALPVRSIGRGLLLADAQGLSQVFVQAGTYPEVVQPTSSGVTVRGGFDLSWVEGDHALVPHRAQIVGSDLSGLAAAVRASGAWATFENLVGRAEFLFFSHNDDGRWWEVWRWPAMIRFGRIFSGVD